jgi:hypothetical protein
MGVLTVVRKQSVVFGGVGVLALFLGSGTFWQLGFGINDSFARRNARVTSVSAKIQCMEKYYFGVL